MNKKEEMIFQALNDLKNRLVDIELKFNIKKERNLEQDVWMPILKLAIGIDDKEELIKKVSEDNQLKTEMGGIQKWNMKQTGRFGK